MASPRETNLAAYTEVDKIHSNKLIESKFLVLINSLYKSYEVLKRFQSSRLVDTTSLIVATDGLNRLFSNNSRIIKLLRGVGLSGVNMAGPLKKVFMRAAMGHLGQLPSLLEGTLPHPTS